MVMVEEIIRTHIDAGYFTRQPEGIVYTVGGHPLLAVTGTIDHEHGLHTRPATALVKESMRLGLTRAYVVAGDRYGRAGSIMSLLMLAARQGTQASLIAEGTDPERLLELYRVLTGNQARA